MIDAQKLLPGIAPRPTALPPPRKRAEVQSVPEPAIPGPRGCRKDAFRRIGPECLRLRSVLYRALAEAGQTGLTDEQLESASGVPGNSLRPRRIELVAIGLAVDSGVRRQTRSGRWATVWIARPAAGGDI